MSEFVFISQISFSKFLGWRWVGEKGLCYVNNSAATLIAETYNASKCIYTRILSKQKVEGGITGYCILIQMKNKYINIKSKETY